MKPVLGALAARVDSEHPAMLVLKIALHTVLLVLLPFFVGGLAGFFVEVSQVRDTLGGLLRFATTLLLPVLLAQCVAIAVKVRRERRALRADGALSTVAMLRAVYRHVRVLTDKGVGLFVMGLVAVALSLGYHFAELGIIAVLGLSTLYVVVTVAVLLSTFVGPRFEERLASRGGSIGREFVPALAESGDSVEERFHLERVPVPAGFRLRVSQHLPARLATESRHVLGAEASMQRVTLSRALRRTPRGDYTLAPADIAYADALGLVRVAVAQSASGRLKVLPRLAPVVMDEAPRVRAPAEGALSVLRKQPTDDWFRVRDYLPGDDARRIHWKLSVKIGRFQVRQPETVPVTRRRVRLVLDSFIPQAHAVGDEADLVLGDLLDHLVELWLSLARALLARGEDVTLVLPTGDAHAPLETVHCRRGTEMRWREVGARARWQGVTDFPAAAADLGAGEFLCVVTARFVRLPALPGPMGVGITWVFLPPGPEIAAGLPGEEVKRGKLARALTTPFAVGSEENGFWPSVRRNQALGRLAFSRADMAAQATQGGPAAEAHLRARGEPFYTVRRSGAAYVLGG